MMMLDARNVPEYYCERCAHGFPIVEKKPSTTPRQPALV
jgi:hypothetical protein